MTRRVTRRRAHTVTTPSTRSSSCTSSKTSCARSGTGVRSDVRHGDPWWRQAGPPRSLGGPPTHRPILNHEGGVEHHPVMSRKGSARRPQCGPIPSRTWVLPMGVAQPRACHRPHRWTTAERWSAGRGWSRESKRQEHWGWSHGHWPCAPKTVRGCTVKCVTGYLQ
jgi:hypothetical protein